MAPNQITAQSSAGAIIYRIIEGKIVVLLLYQNNSFYKRSSRRANKQVIDIGPCGRLEEKESAIVAAHREILQEIGIKVNIDTNFDMSYSYTFIAEALSGENLGKKIRINKTRRYFAARIKEEDSINIKISNEHSKFIWMDINDAINYNKIVLDQKRLLKAFSLYALKKNGL